MKTSSNKPHSWLVVQKCSACTLLNCVPGTGLQKGHLFLIHWKCLLGRNDSIIKSTLKKNKLIFMPIHLFHMIKDLTRSITPTSVPGATSACVVGKTDLTGTTQSLGFHPKPIISTPHILKCSSRCTVTVCIHLSAVKTFFFWTQKSGFCPSSPETQWGPTDSRWQKGQRFPLFPPCPDVIRPYTGDPQQQRKLSERVRHCEHSFTTATTQALSGELQTGGCSMPLVILITAGSEAVVQGRAEARRERQSPGHKDEYAQSLRMPLKSLLLSFWGATGRQYSRRFFLHPENK